MNQPWNSHITHETIWEISVIQIFYLVCQKCLEGLFRKVVRYQKKCINMLKIWNFLNTLKSIFWRSFLILLLCYCLVEVVLNFFLFSKKLLEKSMLYIRKKTTIAHFLEEKLAPTLWFLSTGESDQIMILPLLGVWQDNIKISSRSCRRNIQRTERRIFKQPFTNVLKGTLMQIWKSTYIFVFIWK